MRGEPIAVQTAPVEVRGVGRERPGWAGVALRFARQRPLGAFGGLVILFMGGMAILADLIAPYDPLANDYAHILEPPGAQFWLGADAFGRDVLSRILYGSRTALLVGFSSSFLGATAGAILGVVSAYFGRKTDLLLQRLMDILVSLPIIILALAVVTVLGTGTGNLIIAITIPFIPRIALVMRSSALSVRETPYIEAAQAIGGSHLRVIFLHMLPNLLAPYLIMLTAFLGQAILLEASLSFLGLGVTEPTAAWGLMLKGAAVEFAERAPWMAIFPGLAISAAVLAFNVLGDSLRDALDPKLRMP